jgi:hypothetical protein
MRAMEQRSRRSGITRQTAFDALIRLVIAGSGLRAIVRSFSKRRASTTRDNHAAQFADLSAFDEFHFCAKPDAVTLSKAASDVRNPFLCLLLHVVLLKSMWRRARARELVSRIVEAVLDILSCGCKPADHADGFYYHRALHIARCRDCQEAEWIAQGFEVVNGFPYGDWQATSAERIKERDQHALETLAQWEKQQQEKLIAEAKALFNAMEYNNESKHD